MLKIKTINECCRMIQVVHGDILLKIVKLGGGGGNSYTCAANQVFLFFFYFFYFFYTMH